MKSVAGATTLAELASALANAREEESSIVEDLKAGSEDAYSWLITHYHQQVYSLVYRIVSNPADAADTTQEVFLKVFRGMRHFHGESSLKTWIYRIAVHEACNSKRWWFRHKRRETSLEPAADYSGSAEHSGSDALGLKNLLEDQGDSPFESLAHEEVRERVEQELRQVPEPFRTAVVLRDIEDLSYEEIAEVTQASLGTVKSRLTRGRDLLKKRLQSYVNEVGEELGLATGPGSMATHHQPSKARKLPRMHGASVEVTS
jgi:RNA polymerase sigma-70 factor (ECF subfamily)